ncbi:protein FAM107B isoform X1 [Scyliorhinus canicula]|uniref:protein FAM107B isoform X1 n=2 Tax=Scyliorhinus canicula TaxID=7830 RepID=UPI0018F7A7D1|nr:protein FAM107B isoform X1 [Scyliorhinus canicula]
MQHSHEEELSRLPDMPAAVNGPLSESEKLELEAEVQDFGRGTMAEPDYIDDEDGAELIKPKKLINPVKTSKNHQDLHRELIINQKRGIAPQNKPELQRVMEQRKRDQVVKQKKEEEALKKSDLEQELMKRQQRLDQIEQEKLEAEGKQENAPEFVKMKGNLRRTKHESGDVQVS